MSAHKNRNPGGHGRRHGRPSIDNPRRSAVLSALGLTAACLFLFPSGGFSQDAARPAAPEHVVVNLTPKMAAIWGFTDATKPPYNAKGDGETDDTAALQTALSKGRKVYLPDGVYRVRDTVEGFGKNGQGGPFRTLQGQSREGTILRLTDVCEGFTDPEEPKPVVRTNSQNSGKRGRGQGNQAFNNMVRNLTVDTGKSNPGAVGIDFMCNNMGQVRRVTIRSGDGQGVAGLSMTRQWPGPCIIKHVSVTGFDTGIAVKHASYGVTFEDIELAQQRVVGLENEHNMVAVRRLTSRNSAPAVRNSSKAGLVILLDSRLSGGGPAETAITNHGACYIRDVTVEGYGVALKQGDRALRTQHIDAYVSHPPVARTAIPEAGKRGLDIPVEETPDYWNPDVDEWASVSDFRRERDVDDTASFQRAIDSGKPVVVVPTGRYLIGDTVFVRGTVRHILGCDSRINRSPKHTFQNKEQRKPLFRIETPAEGVPGVIVERLWIDVWRPAYKKDVHAVAFEHASRKSLTLRSITIWGDTITAYRNTPAAGKLFIEDVCSTGKVAEFRFDHPQQVWARQWNPERPDVMIVNRAATIWCLGMKSEGKGTVIYNGPGARTELLGGFFYPVQQTDTDWPACINERGDVSLVLGTVSYKGASTDYAVFLREMREGQVHDLRRELFTSRGPGRHVPLCVSRGNR